MCKYSNIHAYLHVHTCMHAHMQTSIHPYIYTWRNNKETKFEYL